MFSGFRVCWLLLISVSAGSAQIMAAEPPVVSSELEEIVSVLLTRNPSLLSQRMRVNASEALIESAGSLDDPRLTYSVAPSSFGHYIPSGFGNALGVRQNFQLSQSIPWPGKRQLTVQKQAADTLALDYIYSDSRNALVTDLRSVWAQWWYVHWALQNNEAVLQLLTEQSAVAQTRYGNGLESEKNILKIRTFHLKLQHQGLALEEERAQLQSKLNYLIGQSSLTQMPPPADELEGPGLVQKEQLEKWLLETQPVLLALQAKVQSALISRRLTEKDAYPDMQFSLGYNELWNDAEQRLQIGVSFNIPLNRRKRTAQKFSSDYSLHSATLELQSRRDELISQLASKLSSYEQTQQTIQLIESKLLPSSTRLVAANMAEYESGRGDFNELVNAQEDLLNTQLLLRSTYAEKFMVLAQIDRLVGGRLWPIGESL